MKNSRLKNRGQASIEISVALAVILVLLLGSLKIFLWINERLVMRQVDYEQTRVAAGSTGAQPVILTDLNDRPEGTLTIPGEVISNESSYPQLNIFR